MFTTIDVSIFWLILDPIFNLFIPFRCCKSFYCRRRKRIVEKTFDKFNMQLDINFLLNFMRDTISLQSNLKDKEQQFLLRFSKNRTIKLSESEDSKSEEEKRHQLESSEEESKHVEKAEYPNTMKDFFKKSVLGQARIHKDLRD